MGKLGYGVRDLGKKLKYLVLGPGMNDGYWLTGRVGCRWGVAPGGVESISLLCGTVACLVAAVFIAFALVLLYIVGDAKIALDCSYRVSVYQDRLEMRT